MCSNVLQNLDLRNCKTEPQKCNYGFIICAGFLFVLLNSSCLQFYYTGLSFSILLPPDWSTQDLCFRSLWNYCWILLLFHSLSLSKLYLSVSFHPYMWDSIIDNSDGEKSFPDWGLGRTVDKRKAYNDGGDWVTSRTEWDRNWINFSFILRCLFQPTERQCCHSSRWRKVKYLPCGKFFIGIQFYSS